MNAWLADLTSGKTSRTHCDIIFSLTDFRIYLKWLILRTGTKLAYDEHLNI